MGVLLALVAALTYGTADFFGGLATRRAAVLSVVVTTQTTGLVLVLAVAPLVGGTLDRDDLLVSAAGGLAGVVGLLCFYRSLAIGPMSLAAPLSAVLAAIVPLGTGLALGERPGAPAAIGIPLALVAVVLFSRGETADPDHSPTTGAVTRAGSSVLVLSSVAGLGFGLFFVALGQVGEDSGIWPVVIARAASAAAIVGVLVVARTRPAVPRDARGVALGAGLFDAGANVFVLLANREGLLSVVAVIVSMYPAATVVLAQVVLRERFTRTHAVASACALGAIGAFAVAH